jgi:DnaK suppressor protein
VSLSTPRFAPSTLNTLVELLLARRASISRCAENSRSEAIEALSHRDLSDLLDHETPSSDTDAAAVLELVDWAERRLWEIEQALAWIGEASYGYCTICGAEIPLERLKAMPATQSCVGCSSRVSRSVRHADVGRSSVGAMAGRALASCGPVFPRLGQ